MFLNMFHMIADFIVLVTRLTTEELTDEQRMILIDQFIPLIQGASFRTTPDSAMVMVS
jgi:hypothetical protein